MRLPALALLLAVTSPHGAGDAESFAREVDAAALKPLSSSGDGVEDGVLLAGIGDTVPGLFLSLVNDALQGKISPRAIRYDAPSSVILEDAVLSDPEGQPVARVKRARATLSLVALLSKEIVISRIDLVEPRLLLELQGAEGKKQLNLLRALTPKKPPDKSKPPEAAFRIDVIRVERGGFRFHDDKNVTITADDIGAGASLEIDLARNVVIVDVKNVSIASGAVKLPELDVPIEALRAAQVRVLKEHVEIVNLEATAAGAKLVARGSLHLPEPGGLNFKGSIDAPANAWPDRLQRLPFDLPALKGDVEVTGPYQNPKVSIDATLQAAKAYGYAVDGGRAQVQVDKDLVKILEGTTLRAGDGSVRAEGSYELATQLLDLRVRATDLALSRALEPAKLDPAPKGVLQARAHIRGKADGKSALRVDGTFGGRRVEIAGVVPRGELEGSARVTVGPGRVTIDDVSLSGDRLDAQVSGDVFLEEERVALRVAASADDATALVPSVPPDLRADGVIFEGSVNGPYKTIRVEGRARASRGSAYGVPLADVDARINAGAASVTVKNATAIAAGGRLRQLDELVIVLKDKKSIRGTVAVEGVDLARVQAADPRNADLPIAGRADAEAVLSGPYDDPIVDVRAAAGGVVVSGERLDKVVTRLRVTRKLLTIRDITLDGPLVGASARDVLLTLPDLTATGAVRIERLNLAALEAARAAELKGTATGSLTLSGDIRAPSLDASLVARDVAAGPQRFGSGPVNVGLVPDDVVAGTVSGADKKTNHVARMAAELASDIGLWDVTASFAIERKVVNARARITDVDLAPFTQRLGAQVAPLEGYASGAIDAWGPLDKLSMRTRLRVPEVAVARQHQREPENATAPGSSPNPAVAAVPTLRPLGALLLEANMDAGELTGRVCAFPSGMPDPDAPCSRGERVWANILGSLDVLSGAFDLSVSGQVEERALEDLLPALASRGFAVGARARADAQIMREAGKPVDVRAQATLLQASVQPQGSLRADLVAPAELLYADGTVKLETPARFAAPSGEVDVTVGGEVGQEQIALDVNGAIALALGKAFTQQIANASGTAQVQLGVRGNYDKGVVVDGSVTPTKGAVITPRALGQPVTFQSGSLRFAPLDGKDLMRVTAVDVQARIGDGDAIVRGSVDVRTAREADQPWVANWDIAAAGNGLSFKFPSGRGEGSMELTLTGADEAPVLKGRVEITDGAYRKNFELRNFVLEAPPEKESDPLWVTLTPIGLGNLALDVQMTLQNFRARANVADFDADLLLRGNLRLGKSLRLPDLNGAVEVEEGTIDFPNARFEVNEMQVEFPTTGDGRLNPVVHMTARAEIPPGGAGDNDTEIPVDLFLDGDLNKGLVLDLIATDPQREWTKSDLLGLILFGRSFENTLAARDTSIAINALLNEAAAPLTAELERLAQETLGVAVEIDPTGWRWQLGRRLQLEGPGLLTQTGTDSTSTTGTTGTGIAATANDALRLRLLIIDHLPVGKNLSLEGRTSAAGGDLRLSLRLFEE